MQSDRHQNFSRVSVIKIFTIQFLKNVAPTLMGDDAGIGINGISASLLETARYYDNVIVGESGASCNSFYSNLCSVKKK